MHSCTLSNASMVTPPLSWNQKLAKCNVYRMAAAAAARPKHSPEHHHHHHRCRHWRNVLKRNEWIQWFTQWAFNESVTNSFFFIVNIIFAGQCEHWFAPYVLCCCWSHYLWARVLSLIPCLSMCMCAGVVLLLRFDYLDANTHRSLENIWRSNTLIVPNCVARRIQFESLFILNAAVHQASSQWHRHKQAVSFSFGFVDSFVNYYN